MKSETLETTFTNHIIELRQTLISVCITIVAGFLIAFCLHTPLFHLLVPNDLILLSPLEGFTSVIRVSLWFGLVGTSPIWLYFFLQFIRPGLEPKESGLMLPFILLSFLALGLGFCFGFWVMIPLANSYFTTFNAQIGTNLWTLSHYVDYTLTLLFASGILFEIALGLLFLVHVGWISPHFMAKQRRYALVIAFILGALLTPPDVATQVMVAVPLYLLFEFAIVYGKLRHKAGA